MWRRGRGSVSHSDKRKRKRQTDAAEWPQRSTYLHNHIRSDCTPSTFTSSNHFHLLTNISILEICHHLHHHFLFSFDHFYFKNPRIFLYIFFCQQLSISSIDKNIWNTNTDTFCMEKQAYCSSIPNLFPAHLHIFKAFVHFDICSSSLTPQPNCFHSPWEKISRS